MEIDAKEILYSIINEMGKEEVESKISSDPSQSPILIKNIHTKAVALLNSYTDYDKAKVHGDLAEALMHYLLAVLMIPSERKVVCDGIDIDLVIPTVKQLKFDPRRALVLFFPKRLDSDYIRNKTSNLSRAQPNMANIWLVFGHYNDTVADACKGFTVFVHDVNTPFRQFSGIINEIKKFVETNGIKSFKIFRT